MALKGVLDEEMKRKLRLRLTNFCLLGMTLYSVCSVSDPSFRHKLSYIAGNRTYGQHSSVQYTMNSIDSMS